MLALIKSYLKKGGYARMAQISESLEALRKEAPARFLESDQFQEMRKTYEKLKPLADTKPKSFAKQCSEYDFQRIYPVMDAFLSAHDLSTIRSPSLPGRNTMCWATAPPPISSAACGPT